MPQPNTNEVDKSQSEAVKWDDYFDIPTDDLVLVSNDGMHFRFSGYRLSKVRCVMMSIAADGVRLLKLDSSVFKDMLQLPADLPSGSTHSYDAMKRKPIELDYSSRVIQKLMLYVYQSHHPRLIVLWDWKSKYTEYLSLIDSLDHLDCPTLLPLAWTHLSDAARHERCGFEALVKASERNNVEFGADSVAKVWDDEVRALYCSVEHMNAQLDRLQPAWADSLRAKIFVTKESEVTFSEVEKHGGVTWRYDFAKGVRAAKEKHKQGKRKVSQSVMYVPCES